jgi:hypothetical protein
MSPPLTSIPSLLAALEAVPDHRRAAGRRHGLSSVLAFMCCGMLCGNRSLLALAEWGRAHEAWCCQTFGFKRCTHCLNTLHRVLVGLDVVAFEAVLRAWIAAQLAEPEDLEPIAIDGKAVRGTRAGPHLPGAYLLSIYASQRGAVLAQVGIGSRENELTQAIPALQQVDLARKLVTGDALFTQRTICEYILARGGHYLFEVKDNQTTLLADVRRPFRTRSTRWTQPRPSTTPTVAPRSAPCTCRPAWTAGARGPVSARSAASCTRSGDVASGRWSCTTRSPACRPTRLAQVTCSGSVGAIGRLRTNSITYATSRWARTPAGFGRAPLHTRWPPSAMSS